jgi:hypothetical protein
MGSGETMPITPNLIQKIRQQSVQLAEERTSNQQAGQEQAETQSSEQDALATASRRITDQVPTLIAKAIADGSSYAEVMSLSQPRDYCCPSWKDRLFSKSPKSHWLKGRAAAVFAWCQESGLQPTLAPYRDNASNQKSSIIVQWDQDKMQVSLSSDAAFLKQLQAVTQAASSEVMARNAAAHFRSRIQSVRKAIHDMHQKITEASKAGVTETLGAYFEGRSADFDLRGDTWIGDFVKYCDGLGLTVRVQSSPGCEYISNHSEETRPIWTFYIYVSWKAGTTPGE